MGDGGDTKLLVERVVLPDRMDEGFAAGSIPFVLHSYFCISVTYQ